MHPRALQQRPAGFPLKAGKGTGDKGSVLGLTSPGEPLHVAQHALGVGSGLVVVHLARHDVRDPGGAAADGAGGAVQALGVLLPQRHDAAVHVLQDVALCKHRDTASAPTRCLHSPAGCKTYPGKPTPSCLKGFLSSADA